MKFLPTTLAAFALLALAVSPARADVQLTIQDGRVTLVAENATARQILAEWARVGQSKIVGAERLSGPPLTLHLTDVPEAQALQTILRAASGYVVAQRATVVPAASRYDRILILPTSTAPPAAPAQSAGMGGRNMNTPPPPMLAPPPQPGADAPMAQDAPDDPEPADDDQPQPAGPMVNPYVNSTRPPETNFDYANPQQLMQRRMELEQQIQQQQQQQGQGPALFPGSVVPGTTSQTPQSGPQPNVGAPTSAARPGEMIQPPAPNTPAFQNPYGIPGMPTPTQPATTPPPEPDRSKYQNPYRPPPR